jgi:predicted signal transduction protein with EAL and GGDEF domain
MVIVSMFLFHIVLTLLNRNIDKMFFTTEYRQRQWLRDFSVNMANKLGLDEITNTFLEAVRSVLRVKNVYLALYNEEKKEYTISSGFLSPNQITYTFSDNNPIVLWMDGNNTCLTYDQIEKLPIFKSLWDSEIDLINGLGTELVVPLKSRSRMIGVLILSKKQDNTSFSMEDMDLLLSLGGSTAIALDNAFSYERAKNEANTDSLTGLYNHRYFYRELKRLILETDDNPLSLILLDLDMFKLYNDMYGHVEGDKALKLSQKFSQPA